MENNRVVELQSEQPHGNMELPSWEIEVKPLLRQGKKIQAVKVVREAIKGSLAEAKEIVDSWQEEQ